MKKLTIVLILLVSSVVNAQQIIILPSQPAQPLGPALQVDPNFLLDGGYVLTPPPPRRQGYLYNTTGQSYQYRETKPGSNSFWLYPMKTGDDCDSSD